MKNMSFYIAIIIAFVLFVGCQQETTQLGETIENGINDNGNFVINHIEIPFTSMKTVLEYAVTVTGSDESWNTYYDPSDDEYPYYGEFAVGKTKKIYPYRIGKYEVTQKLFAAVMGISQRKINKQEGLSRDYGIGDNYPVYCVSFYDAIAFCNKLSILMGKTPCYRVWGVTDWEGLEYSNIPTENNVHWNEVELDSLDGYRLPAEYEWEFAARGGDQSKSDWKYAFAGIQFASNLGAEYDTYLDTVGWYVNNSSNTIHPVGQKKYNRLGLFDMSGNVGEICYSVVSVESSGKSYVYFRGGSFIEPAKKCTVSALAVWYPYDSSLMSLGFRLVQSITD